MSAWGLTILTATVVDLSHCTIPKACAFSTRPNAPAPNCRPNFNLDLSNSYSFSYGSRSAWGDNSIIKF